MVSLNSLNFRNVGLAETKYLAEGELEYRREVARQIRFESQVNDSEWALPGTARTLRRNAMLRRQADRFETCGLEWSMIGCKDCGGIFIGPRRCEVRICEHCAMKWAFKLLQRQLALAKVLKPSADGRRSMMVTVTLYKHPLYGLTDNDVDRLFRSFKKLMHTLWPASKGCGAFAVMEIGEGFNLHIHALVYGYYVDKRVLSELWQKFTGDSKIVRIREVKKPNQTIRYLLKYITKPDPNKNPERAARWLSLVTGRRRVRTYGTFYGKMKLFLPPKGCPCPLCKGKLGLIGFDTGKRIPLKAMFWDEAFKSAATKKS
jgi:hypothetical protein